ncbi:MAG: DUF5675 family protein [Gammaproteobacteria bacterium]|nr:DUF5675 family protein [Gammaproteobacteria bacterium]
MRFKYWGKIKPLFSKESKPRTIIKTADAVLERFETGEQGTFGRLNAIGGFSCFTVELPDYNNAPNVSSIPLGRYTCVLYQSKKFGTVFHLTAVTGRTYILIHNGNYAGDTEKGWKTHSLGCIILGSRVGTLAGQKAVLSSRVALRRFKTHMGDGPFLLDVINKPGGL